MITFLNLLSKASLFLRAPALTLASLIFCLPSLASYQIGEYRLARADNRPSNFLTVAPAGRAGLGSMRFVGRVGGVNFEGVIDLSQYQKGQISIAYDPTRQDGSRAILNINGKPVPVPLPDWQLRPIAEFSDSKFTAAVSLFGKGPEQEKYYYIDYHPAFFDRLLGLRLLQADIILMDATQLRHPPKSTAGNETPTGTGEPRFENAKSENAARIISEVVKRHDMASWVLTDVDSNLPPSISERDGRIVLEGMAYYYFWKPEDLQATSAQEERMESLLKRYLFARSSGDSPNAAKIAAEIRGLQDTLTRVQPVTEATNEMRRHSSSLRDLNPQVYDAVQRTAVYSALFRGIKAADPNTWRAFIERVRSIPIARVEVPNQFPK